MKLISAFLIFIMIALSSPLQAELPEVEGGGYVPEQGENLYDGSWNLGDMISVTLEGVASVFSGVATFQLLYCGAKYAVHQFFAKEVKPTEVWLEFIQQWRAETYLNAPEDFRSATAFLLSHNVDISWVIDYCDYMSRREGWYNIYPPVWEVVDDDVDAEGLENSIDLNGAHAATPETTTRMAGMVGGGLVIARARLAIRVGASKVFESLINSAARAGWLEKSVGIAKGAEFINLKYGSDCGTDGVFINPNGEFHVLEGKWWQRGGGKLSQIEGKFGNVKWVVTQGEPSWAMKAMYQVKIHDPKRFAYLMGKYEHTEFGAVLCAVEHVEKKLPSIIQKELRNYIAEYLKNHPGEEIDEIKIAKFTAEIKEYITNFADHVKLRQILEEAGEMEAKLVPRIAGWLEKYAFTVLNKTGAKPTNFTKVAPRLLIALKAFGGRACTSVGKIKCFAVAIKAIKTL